MRPLKNWTVPQLMQEIAVSFPDQCAIRYKGCSWTYQQMDMLTDRLAQGLLAMGVAPGDRVALMTENTARGIFLFYAALKMGAVVCMINTSLKSDELLTLFESSDIDHLVMGSHYKNNYFYEEYLGLADRYPLKQVFDIGEPPRSPFCNWDMLLDTEGQDTLETVKARMQPADPCLILYTSGTTGKVPKGVVLSQYHLANAGGQKADSMGLEKEDILCCALQLFHVFCIDVDVLAALSVGACLAMPEDLHTASILHTIETEKCTVLSAVPCTFQVMTGREDFKNYDVSSLRTGIIGGAYCSPELFQKIDRALDFTLLPGLGQTEAAAGIAIGSLGDSLEIRSRTVGHFVPHSEGMIQDLETGQPVTTGVVGEVCIRSSMLMLGYYRQPEMTRLTIDPAGWLHTGDLGWQDPEGYIHISGRLKEIINRGGEKIIPLEIEDQICQMEAVAECVVIGVEDDYYGEEPCACIVKRPGAELLAETVREFLTARIASYKIPRYIRFLDTFPRTTTGKVQKGELRRSFRKGEDRK